MPILRKSRSPRPTCGIPSIPSVTVFPSNCSLCFKVMTWYIFIASFCLPCLRLSHFNLAYGSCVSMGQSSIFHPGEALFDDYCFFTSRLAMFQDLSCHWIFSPVLHYSLNIWCNSGHPCTAAIMSRSQPQKVSDGELCFSGKHDSYPRQLLFVKMGMIDSFLTLSVVECMRQNVLTSWKISVVSHFLLCDLLPEGLPPKFKMCILSSNSVSGPIKPYYMRGNDAWQGANKQIHDTDTKKHKQREAFTPRAFQSCSTSLQDFCQMRLCQSQPKLSMCLGMKR